VSPPTPGGKGRRCGSPAPAPPDAFVAVLQKRGRFLVAEPLFAEGRGEADRPRQGRGRATIASGRGGSAGAVAAGVGDLVLAHTTQRGTRVLRVLGRPEVARDVIEGLLLDRGASRGFDPALEREAGLAREQSLESAHRQVLAGRRRDLRELPTFTIDPAGARDFDDAVSAEALTGDARRVWVHIADVGAHVPEGSLVDREARRRSTSVYVPGTVEPMLPQALCDDACSLLEGLERPAVTVELELHGAKIVRAAFYRSLIRSDARLDYERVDRIFAAQESAPEPWGVPLGVAREVAAALQAARERDGELIIDSHESEFLFDRRGDVSEIRASVQTESHRLIEHLMIAANEAVAELLAQRGVPCLYRVHERPDPERIERLVDQLASLQVPTPPLPDVLSGSQASELLGPISKLLRDHVRRTGRGRIALGSLLLRSLKQARYSPENLGHAGLRSPAYCHFTSPIRRYPDLVCHRALLSAVGAGESAPLAGELVELGEWTSDRERHAMTLERDADDIARCFALERALYEGGWEQAFTGEVVGLISAGAFVMFCGADTPAYEGMLPVRKMSSLSAPGGSAGGRGRGRTDAAPAREWWELNEQGTILRGERTGTTLRLGDPLEVRVERVEPIRGRADLLAAGAAEQPGS
jgi:ribonuclease R